MERGVIIFSDAHGDTEALERVWEAKSFFQAERLLSLGDLTPDPWNPLFSNIEGVRGNCDRYYEYGDLPYPGLTLSLEIYGKSLFMTHGHLPFDIPSKTDIVLTGHTHIPSLEKRGEVYYLNPGSISLPRSSLGATFALFTPYSLSLLSLFDFSLIKSLSFSSSK